MTWITACANQKGGVGKTETSRNTAAALAELGRRVVLVDLDPQGHLTGMLKYQPVDTGVNLAAALTGDWSGNADDLLIDVPSQSGRLQLIPTHSQMFIAGRLIDQLRAREHRLELLLGQLDDEVDHVIIDCPPTLDILTDNALTAADGIIIPVQAEDTTVRALRLLLGQLEAVDADLRKTPLVLHGLVVSLLRRPVNKVSQSVLDQLEQLEHLPILATVPASVTVTRAQRSGKGVVEYAPRSEHAEAYRTIARHIDDTAKKGSS